MEDEQLLTCPLCARLYRKPKLAPCLHSFCEICLHGYIGGAPSDPCVFRCPACKLEANIGRNRESWVRQLPDNDFLSEMVERRRRDPCCWCQRSLCRGEPAAEKLAELQQILASLDSKKKEFGEKLNEIVRAKNSAMESLDWIKTQISERLEIKATEWLEKAGDSSAQRGYLLAVENASLLLKSMIKHGSDLHLLTTGSGIESRARALCQHQMGGEQLERLWIDRERTVEKLGRKLEKLLVKRFEPGALVTRERSFHTAVRRDSASCKPTSFVLVEDGHVLLTDWNNWNVKKFSPDGHLVNLKGVPSRPAGIASIEASRVVVTLPLVAQILFLEHGSSIEVTAIVRTMKRYSGISASGAVSSPLLCCCCSRNWDPTSVDIISYEGKIIKSININQYGKSIFSAPEYIAVRSDESILVSDFWKKSLFCIDAQKNIIFCYKGTSTVPLLWPLGVDFDEKGFIYVTDWLGNSVHRLYPDGKLDCVLLTGSDVNKPYSALATAPDKLFVVEDGGCMKVFTIHRHLDELSSN